MPGTGSDTSLMGISLTATEDATITSVTIGGAVAVANGGEVGGAVAGAGAGSTNTVKDVVEAYLSNSANKPSDTINSGGGGIEISASDSSTIDAYAGADAVGIGIGGMRSSGPYFDRCQ